MESSTLVDNVVKKLPEEEHAHNETTPYVPNRLFRQAPSTNGKVAYVIFGVTESSGVYHNWSVYSCLIITTAFDPMYRLAAKHYLSSFPPNLKPDNRGYGSYLEADEAWGFFQQTGVVPLGPSDGGVSASTMALRSLPSLSLALGSPAHRVPSSSAHQPPQVDLTAHPPFRTAVPPTFYIVHVGYSPGVYNSL